jgi:hypothetical protein
MKHSSERRAALAIQRPTFGVFRPQEDGTLEPEAFKRAMERLFMLRRSLERRSIHPGHL